MLLPVGAGGVLQDVREPLFRATGTASQRFCVSAAFCHKHTRRNQRLVSAAGSDLLLQINVFLCTLTFETPLCLLFYFLHF